MPGHGPFRGHRFPRDVILLAVRWYCRYSLSPRDVHYLLAERGVAVDAAVHRLVRKLVCIITDKAHAYARVIGEINEQLRSDDAIRHFTRKYFNNRIESDHVALKRLLTPMRGFRSLSSAKATLSGIEAIRAIRAGAVEGAQRGVAKEVGYLRSLFEAV